MADDSDSTAAAGSGGPGGARRRALRATGWMLAVVLLLVGSGLVYLYQKFNGNLSGVDINGVLGADRPEDIANGSMDLLVLGSDSRAGRNGRYGRDQGTSRSDTAMVVHIHQGRHRASVVSIPRDTLVQRPSCIKDGKRIPPAGMVMFNSAYQVGGPACAVKTVESMTGIRMDHYLELDFSGFKNLVDELGGVKLTTTAPIHDRKSHLDLPAGTHRLDGEQALGLVRTRHGVGDGSDLGRIKIQHAFLKAMLDQIRSIGLFSSPKKLYDLADTSTSALTTDTDLASVDKLLGLARGLKDISSRDLRMITLPVRYDRTDPSRVVPVLSRTMPLWQALRHDKAIPGTTGKGTAGERTDADDVVRAS